MATARSRVASIFDNPTPATHQDPPDLGKEAEAAADAEQDPPSSTAISTDPAPKAEKATTLEVPDLPLRAPAKKKVWFYVSTPVADQLDKLVRYAAFHFGLKQGEVQEIALAMGLDNEAEILRALRERAS